MRKRDGVGGSATCIHVYVGRQQNEIKCCLKTGEEKREMGMKSRE
jgi:hypothetical protein